MTLPYLHVVGAYYSHRPDLLLDPRHTRLRLLHEWVARLLDTQGVKVTIVEHTIGERPYELDPDDVRLRHVKVLQLRGDASQEYWISWALLNYGMGHQPEEARYLCWQDTDITHIRPDWAILTVDMLQTHRVGQTWTDHVDLGPRGEQVPDENGIMVGRSWSKAWQDGDIRGGISAYAKQVFTPEGTEKKPDHRAHPGYSVAIRRDVLNGIGRLIDWDVTGSADWQMFRAFCGTLNTFDPSLSPAFNRKLREFASRCDEYIRQDIGVVPGLILAGYHGKKHDRFYRDRNDILRESGYDPDIDITYDTNGLPRLCTDNRVLRDWMRRYNTLRNEDSVDIHVERPEPIKPRLPKPAPEPFPLPPPRPEPQPSPFPPPQPRPPEPPPFPSPIPRPPHPHPYSSTEET